MSNLKDKKFIQKMVLKYCKKHEDYIEKLIKGEYQNNNKFEGLPRRVKTK